MTNKEVVISSNSESQGNRVAQAKQIRKRLAKSAKRLQDKSHTIIDAWENHCREQKIIYHPKKQKLVGVIIDPQSKQERKFNFSPRKNPEQWIKYQDIIANELDKRLSLQGNSQRKGVLDFLRRT